MKYLDLSAKKALATQLLRIKAQEMTPNELDLAMALILQHDVELPNGRIGEAPSVQQDAQWAPFSPMTNWEHMGQVLAGVALVTGSHELQEDDADIYKVTGHWYSCHGYFGGVKAEGREYQRVVGETVAMLLEHHVKYRWQA